MVRDRGFLVFVNPAGQRDNLGDSVLRRPYLDVLRKVGRLHVLVGNDLNYASGLGLLPDDELYSSKAQWLMNAFAAAGCRRLVFAANAGEYVGGLAEMLRSIWQPALASIACVSGGKVILAGASIRPGTNVVFSQLRVLSHLAIENGTWRDAETRRLVGRGLVQPDWAFRAGGQQTLRRRSRLTVVARGDRPLPPPEWFQSLKYAAATQKLELSVLVQVIRDRERGRVLADRLSCRLVDWSPEVTHSAHEAVVRQEYAESIAVVSDRIHALIIGATEGASPIPFSTMDFAKIERTLSFVFSHKLVNHCAHVSVDTSRNRYSLLSSDIDRTRDALAAVEDSVLRSFGASA